ncbi:ABC transporter substrate-binding protein [Nesterenkonia muleiensis]|uniref:ABC transporter substrate-binding protein n=1 Tax=Nesterenkonia muleiensis TaxID=2282648 RepID=UPI001300386A|nr:ABC transporter substrate-binding protein [Nesterenkonia muleiensis]
MEDAGVIEWAYNSEPHTLDPLQSFEYGPSMVLANMCETLLHQEDDFSTSPGLAESWEYIDETTLVFTIQEGVTFWNSDPMTAEDVAFSLNRHLTPDTWWGRYFAHVESVEVTGDYEVTVHFDQPDALFLSAMAQGPGIVTSQAAVEEAGDEYGNAETGVECTGPFVFEEWRSGSFVEMSRNDNYWNGDGAALSSGLRINFITDESTLANGLTSESLDGAYFIWPPEIMDTLEDSGVGELIHGQSLQVWDLLLSGHEGPLGDDRVREALSLAMDREGIAEAVFFSSATPAKTHDSPEYWTYEEDVFSDAYDAFPDVALDIDRAQELVAEAEADGVEMRPLQLTYSADQPSHEASANLVQAAGEAIGLEVTLDGLPGTQMAEVYSVAEAQEGVDMFFGTWFGVADPLDMYSMFVEDEVQNYPGYYDMSDLVTEARRALDDAERAQLVTEIQEEFVDNNLWLPLNYVPSTLFQNNSITGATASFSYMYSPWAISIGTAE